MTAPRFTPHRFLERPRGFASLTARMRQIADMRCQGMTEPEIAETLHRSRTTIKNVMTVCFERTGTRNIAAFCMQYGIFQAAHRQTVRRGSTTLRAEDV